jgi:hypothetical protein
MPTDAPVHLLVQSHRGCHVLLELRLAEGRGVGGNEDELGLAAAKGLEGAPVAQHNLARLDDEGELFSCQRRSIKIVDVGKRTLAPMDWASDLDFLGAIATVMWLVGKEKG